MEPAYIEVQLSQIFPLWQSTKCAWLFIRQ